MKNLKFLLLFLFIPFFGFTQSLNGVYTGVLSNDSTTVRKDQSFEMALTEYNGKVYGYAYSTFIVNDTLYYIVKRVKGKVEGDICEVEDDDVISHNFPQKPERKVFVTYTLRRNVSDSSWKLDGNWKTNVTKKYYAISGTVETKEEKDLSKSKLYEHLGDLDLQKTLAFNKPKETTPEKKLAKGKDNKNDVAKNTVKKEDKKDVAKTETKSIEKKPDASIAKTDTKTPDSKTTSVPAKDVVVANTNDKKPETSIAKTEIKVPENKTVSSSITNPPIQNEKKNELVITANPVEKKPETTVVKSETKLPDNKSVVATTNNQPNQNEKKDVIGANSNNVEKKPETNIAKTETKLLDNKTVFSPVTNQPTQNVKKDVVATNTNNTNGVKPETKQSDSKLVSVPVGNQPTQNTKKDVAISTTPNDKKSETSITKQETKIPDSKTTSTSTITPVIQTEKKDVTAVQKKPETNFEFQEISRARANRTLKPAAALVDGRETKPSETIFFTSDSLSIALYDNGEVDGDSVSVIINDVMFIEKQGLRSSAFRKTFYVPANESDSLLVVLYADNLGKYPPNTGLLQIKDGEEIYYVRFKADLDRNAAIVLRRKPK